MYSSVDVIWTLFGAALVFFMQAGFAMCEAGMTRAKNTGNILMKNLMDFSIGTPAYWLLGFGLMFGGSGAIVGSFDPFIQGSYDFGSLPTFCFVIFQTVFCATAATIVSGSMAERTKFSAYCIYSAVISLIVYPISGHWIWGGGWLGSMGFHDFAGSCAVHMVGGVAACVGAAVLGPRIGKYNKYGKPRAIPGHNLTVAALGVFILWFCWFGFNGASTVSMTGDEILETASIIFMNTNLAAAVSTCTVMILTWLLFKKPDVSMSLNGALAGLVAITAGCDCVSSVGAAIIGILAGFVVVGGVEFFEKVVKIDDPVGAISVHGCCGILGTICVGLFSMGADGVDAGLFYGGGVSLLGIQTLGVLAVAAWVGITMFAVFKLIDVTMGLRVTKEIEVEGLDLHEHGLASAYEGFVITDVYSNSLNVNENTDLGEDVIAGGSQSITSEDAAVSVTYVHKTSDLLSEAKIQGTSASSRGIHTIVIIAKMAKLDTLKQELNKVGITGMTVTNVMGCGIQKGMGELYRGVEMDATLLPKVKVEVVVGKLSVDTIINATKKALYTGHIGDGKIFVYDVTRVVKVRTGEENIAALQDVE